MAQKFSRRKLAQMVAARLQAGVRPAALGPQIAAYLVVHKMTDQVEMLLRDIAHELAAQKMHLFATATSAHPLASEVQQHIATYLRGHYQVQAVELATKIDPNLVGGVLIETPSETRDATIRAKLRRLQQA